MWGQSPAWMPKIRILLLENTFVTIVSLFSATSSIVELDANIFADQNFRMDTERKNDV